MNIGLHVIRAMVFYASQKCQLSLPQSLLAGRLVKVSRPKNHKTLYIKAIAN